MHYIWLFILEFHLPEEEVSSGVSWGFFLVIVELKELVTFEEAVVKPKPLNVSNTKGKK